MMCAFNLPPPVIIMSTTWNTWIVPLSCVPEIWQTRFHLCHKYDSYIFTCTPDMTCLYLLVPHIIMTCLLFTCTPYMTCLLSLVPRYRMSIFTCTLDMTFRLSLVPQIWYAYFHLYPRYYMLMVFLTLPTL